VEDESLGQEKLQGLLAQEPEVEWIGQAMTGPEAVLKIRELRPDLVFLDIQLPGYTGFSVLEQLDGELPKAVIFVTAHDEFALKAFEFNAVDYVLKPLDRARFKLALRRALDRLRGPLVDDITTRLSRLLGQMSTDQARDPDRIAIRTSGRILFLQLIDIDWIGSDDNYVEIHVANQTHRQNETLTSMEQRLPRDIFVRISRTVIVNRRRIREIQPLFHGQYAVLLHNGTRLTLSRSRRSELPRLGVS
jgi:two-component system LytT family response regulator